MAAHISDRWLWIGLGIFTFFAVRGVAYGLTEVIRLTEITKLPKQPTKVPRSAEDAIKTESLELLATSSNVEIRKAASKMLCDRFLRNTKACALLAEDFNSSDPNVKEQAVKVMELLERHVNESDWWLSVETNEEMARSAQQLNLLPLASNRSRLQEESPEEQALRRRRREAMVLNEGDRPVSQDDIIQRGGGMSDDDTQRTEQALADLAQADRSPD